MADNLNAVSVPIYLIKSAGDTLRLLGDVCARKDLGDKIRNARSLARSFERLAKAQSFPGGEEVVAKAQLTKIPDRSWRQAVRVSAMEDLFKDKILPVFERLDDGCKGQCRFHLVLTFVGAQ